jgi:nucleotide-binding universal stress UspA family protein
MASFRRILFASDFSKASRKAFTTAVTLAKAHRATLTVLHVIVPFTPIVPEGYVDSQMWARIDKDAREWSLRQLRRLTDQARATGVKAAVSSGRRRATNRSRRSIEGADLWSSALTAEQVDEVLRGQRRGRLVATAPCPVVTVRASRHREPAGQAEINGARSAQDRPRAAPPGSSLSQTTSRRPRSVRGLPSR